MTESTLLWIFGAIIGVQTTVIGAIAAALWVHVGHCKDVAAAMARIESCVDRLSEDIGTHETGLRGAVHQATNKLLVMSERVEALGTPHRKPSHDR